MCDIPESYEGWWRIVHTGTWVDDGLDDLGPALLYLGGEEGKLRMHCLLATVDAHETLSGIAFSWHGAWEFDPKSGTGSARLVGNDRLEGEIRIRQGDSSSFVAERTEAPDAHIPDPPDPRDKWRRRW